MKFFLMTLFQFLVKNLILMTEFGQLILFVASFGLTQNVLFVGLFLNLCQFDLLSFRDHFLELGLEIFDSAH